MPYSKAWIYPVPGETEKTGGPTSLSGGERLLEDDPALDGGEGPQELQYLWLVPLSGNKNEKYFNVN